MPETTEVERKSDINLLSCGERIKNVRLFYIKKIFTNASYFILDGIGIYRKCHSSSVTCKTTHKKQ